MWNSGNWTKVKLPRGNRCGHCIENIGMLHRLLAAGRQAGDYPIQRLAFVQN